MKDWRGNEYKEEILRDGIGKPIPCENKDCLNPAVRNCCIAEGDIGRTHWHGEIHTSDGNLMALCKSCSEKDHAKWRK